MLVMVLDEKFHKTCERGFRGNVLQNYNLDYLIFHQVLFNISFANYVSVQEDVKFIRKIGRGYLDTNL